MLYNIKMQVFVLKIQKTGFKNTKLFLNNYAACELKTYDNWKFDGKGAWEGLGRGL